MANKNYFEEAGELLRKEILAEGKRQIKKVENFDKYSYNVINYSKTTGNSLTPKEVERLNTLLHDKKVREISWQEIINLYPNIDLDKLVVFSAGVGSCKICSNLDGRIFFVGKAVERPHPNCKCKFVTIAEYLTFKNSADTDGSTVKLNVGDKYFDINGKVVNGRVIANLREVAEALGYKVNWDAKTKKVTITNDEGYTLSYSTEGIDKVRVNAVDLINWLTDSKDIKVENGVIKVTDKGWEYYVNKALGIKSARYIPQIDKSSYVNKGTGKTETGTDNLKKTENDFAKGIGKTETNPNGNVTNTDWQNPVTPIITNNPGERSADAYNKVLDQFAVETNPRYTPREGSTFCNIYAQDVMKAMGASIPLNMDAAGMQNWLSSDAGKSAGWKAVTAQQAQENANKGNPAVGVNSGHIAMIAPSPYENDGQIYVSQAGGAKWIRRLSSIDNVWNANESKSYFIHD